MCDFIRRQVPNGAQLRIWSEPIDGANKRYRSTARLRNSNQNLVWDDENFTEADQANPLTAELKGARKFWGSIRITFATSMSTRLYNEVWVKIGGVWRRHGERKACTFTSNSGNAILEAFIYVTMR